MRFLSYILVFAFLCSLCSAFFPYLNYELNLDKIIENYCINKDKPELHCQGKCHLQKLIKDENERAGKIPAKLIRKEIQLYWQQLNAKSLLFHSTILLFSFPKELSPTGIIPKIFHPPKLI